MEIERMPIYFVITESVHIFPQSQQYLLKYIKRVIECDLSEVQDIYNRIVAPMYNEGLHVQVEYFLREPPSPFRNWNEIELAQLKEQEERNRRERVEYLERTTDPYKALENVEIHEIPTPEDARHAGEVMAQLFELYRDAGATPRDEKPGALPGDDL